MSKWIDEMIKDMRLSSEQSERLKKIKDKNTVFIDVDQFGIKIHGNTYPLREVLKKQGFKYDGGMWFYKARHYEDVTGYYVETRDGRKLVSERRAYPYDVEEAYAKFYLEVLKPILDEAVKLKLPILFSDVTPLKAVQKHVEPLYKTKSMEKMA